MIVLINYELHGGIMIFWWQPEQQLFENHALCFEFPAGFFDRFQKESFRMVTTLVGISNSGKV